MKRILHITGKMDRAGAETMIMNLYRAIDRTQFQFDFMSFSVEEGDYDDEIKSLGGRIFNISSRNPIKRMFQLKSFLKGHPEYKIVHSHTLFSNAFHILAAKMATIPYRIAHSHNTSAQSEHKQITDVYYKISKRIIDKYATHFIGCGVAAATFLFPKQKKVLILPNSIDTRYFADIGENETEYINNEFGITTPCLKIIQLGRLQTVKNHVFSLQIAEKLKEKGITFHMFFIGQGDLNQELAEQIKEKSLINEVHMLGLRSDIPQLLAGADAMLMPSLHEGFPVALVEAQSAGIPSLVSNTVSPEVDLKLGLVEFESLASPVEKWVDQLLALHSKNNMSKEIRVALLAKQGFDINSSARILSKFYQSLH